MTTDTKKAFVPTRLKYTLGETEYELKLTSSFNFHELARLAEIEADMDEVMEKAHEEGAVDEETVEMDMTRVKFAMPFVESTLRVLQIHFQDALTLDELKEVDADQIAEIRLMLEEEQGKLTQEREKEADMKAQKQLINQKKSNSKT